MKRMPALFAALGVLLAGCASSTSGTNVVDERMTPGMVMPDGSTMGPANQAARVGPSAAALMICALETRHSVATVLKLRRTPDPVAHWSKPTYTCAYDLPQGRLVLSVHESPTHAAAVRFAARLQRGLPGGHPLAGLTVVAYGSAGGDVVLVKDGDTLRVDAGGLPAEFGSEHEKRADFAYEIASDVLGCWTGD